MRIRGLIVHTGAQAVAFDRNSDIQKAGLKNYRKFHRYIKRLDKTT